MKRFLTFCLAFWMAFALSVVGAARPLAGYGLTDMKVYDGPAAGLDRQPPLVRPLAEANCSLTSAMHHMHHTGVAVPVSLVSISVLSAA